MRAGALLSLVGLAAGRLVLRNSSLVGGYDALVNVPDAVKTPWPVLLWLHGGGERTSNLDDLKYGQGMTGLIEKRQSDGNQTIVSARLVTEQLLFVAPQHPAETEWSSDDSWHPEKLGDLLDGIAAEYAIDSTRVCIGGYSMGARGLWRTLQRYPNRFAAGLAIAGLAENEAPDALLALVETPTIEFHGTEDAHINITYAVQLEANLKALANATDTSSDSILIEIRGGTHDIADAALEYDDAYAIRWALTQSTASRRDFDLTASTAAQNANLTIGEPSTSTPLPSAGAGRSVVPLSLLSLLPLSLLLA